VREYCAEHKIEPPADSTLRGWLKNTQSIRTGGLKKTVVIQRKHGPSLTLGETVEKWVHKKCMEAFKRGVRTSYRNVQYVTRTVIYHFVTGTDHFYLH
jgi:hypothetical protein